MPSSWEFQLKMAAYADAWSESSLERRATALRALGRLPSGPRGRGAPDINGINGANLIIAASVGRSYDQEELGQTITTWESMVAQDDMSDAPLLLGKRKGTPTFGEVLARCLEDAENAVKRKTLTICRTWPEAELRYVNEAGEARAIKFELSDEKDRAFWRRAVREDITFGPGVLHQWAIVLRYGRARAEFLPDDV